MVNIETGVDKLVNLVNQKKKVSLDQAAKTLGVSTLVVQEWVDFLEEEGIIGVEYSLSKVYLVERKLGKKEVEKKEKEYTAQKDAFVRKVESTLKSLDGEALALDKVRKEFSNLKKELDNEMSSVRKDLEEMKKFEEIKKSIDTDIIRQKEDFTRVIDASRRQIKSEEKEYEKIINEIRLQREEIQNEKGKIKNLDSRENEISEKISLLNESLINIKNKTSEEKDFLKLAEKNLNKLTKVAEEIEEDIKSKKESVITPLIKISEEHRNKVLRVQEDLLLKVAEKKKEIDVYTKTGIAISKKFSEFFGEKSKLTKQFEAIQKESDEIKASLNNLIKKARSFDLTSKISVKKFSADLDVEFKKTAKKQEELKSKVKKLADELKNK